jgi:hypothetical protein
MVTNHTIRDRAFCYDRTSSSPLQRHSAHPHYRTFEEFGRRGSARCKHREFRHGQAAACPYGLFYSYVSLGDARFNPRRFCQKFDERAMKGGQTPSPSHPFPSEGVKKSRCSGGLQPPPLRFQAQRRSESAATDYAFDFFTPSLPWEEGRGGGVSGRGGCQRVLSRDGGKR